MPRPVHVIVAAVIRVEVVVVAVNRYFGIVRQHALAGVCSRTARRCLETKRAAPGTTEDLLFGMRVIRGPRRHAIVVVIRVGVGRDPLLVPRAVFDECLVVEVAPVVAGEH